MDALYVGGGMRTRKIRWEQRKHLQKSLGFCCSPIFFMPLCLRLSFNYLTASSLSPHFFSNSTRTCLSQQRANYITHSEDSPIGNSGQLTAPPLDGAPVVDGVAASFVRFSRCQKRPFFCMCKSSSHANVCGRGPIGDVFVVDTTQYTRRYYIFSAILILGELVSP